MRLVFIREKDNATFEIDSVPYGGYILDPSTQIPPSGGLDTTGYEYSGRVGGYATSARTQRTPFSPNFTIQEHHSVSSGLVSLIREAKAFFDPHEDDLEPLLYSVEFYTDDKDKASFMMRHGVISVPVMAMINRGDNSARGQMSFIFDDPYLYPIGDSGLTVRLYAAGQESGDPNGRLFDDTDGAMWDASVGKLWVSDGGQGEPISVDITTVASVPVSIVTSGQLISPQILNLTDGSSFTYNGTLESLDVLTVDTAGVVLVNGVLPPFGYAGTLTAQDGINTFALVAASGSPGYADLTILGAF